MLDDIRLNIPFNFAIPRSLNLFLQAPVTLKSKTIYKGNSVIKNIKCPIVFEFRAKLCEQEIFGF